MGYRVAGGGGIEMFESIAFMSIDPVLGCAAVKQNGVAVFGVWWGWV